MLIRLVRYLGCKSISYCNHCYVLSCDCLSRPLQCQKFGEYHKDDPSSFKFSDNFSLYPQVNVQSLVHVLVLLA